MKQSKFTGLLFFAAMSFFLTSCGGGESKEEASTDSTTVESTTNAVTPEVNTIVTTPQNMMVVTHKVSDFEKFKTSYDEHDSLRLANGIHSFVIGRGIDDPNMVLVAVKCDDMAKAKAFAKDPGLKAAMQKGGVVGAPTIMFNTMAYQDNAKNMSDLRSMTNFTVKDWAAWKVSFESHRQTRIDNGLTDRAYGYDADDNHKVTLVVAVNDTAKANAFWKSDLLKKQRAEGGVIGEPKRHVYRVVQKY